MYKSLHAPSRRPAMLVEESSQFPLPDGESRLETNERWRVRLITVATASSVILNIGFIILIVSMFPLSTFLPYEMRLVPTEVARARVADVSTYLKPEQVQILAREQVEAYVVHRNEIVRSADVMQQRWANPGVVSMESTPKVYEDFLAAVGPGFQEIRQSDATVQVHLDATNVIQDWSLQQAGFYQIQFTLIERDAREKVIFRQAYQARIKVDYVPLEHVLYDMRFYNPTGFQVQAYAVNPM